MLIHPTPWSSHRKAVSMPAPHGQEPQLRLGRGAGGGLPEGPQRPQGICQLSAFLGWRLWVLWDAWGVPQSRWAEGGKWTSVLGPPNKDVAQHSWADP